VVPWEIARQNSDETELIPGMIPQRNPAKIRQKGVNTREKEHTRA
jgi:hypothetical protein